MLTDTSIQQCTVTKLVYDSTRNGAKVALKVYSCTGDPLADNIENLAVLAADREAHALRSLSQGSFPFVPALQEAIRTATQTANVLEYAPSSVQQLLADQPQGLPLTEVRKIMYQCTAVLAALHDMQLVHGRLSPSKLRLADSGGLKLCGLGSLQQLDCAPAGCPLPTGSARWTCAPELLLGGTAGPG